MSSSKFIRISSNERMAGGRCNTFSVNFGGNTSYDLSNVTAIRFKYVSFANSEYNVNSKNNVLGFSHSIVGGSFITLDVGQYTLNDLITQLGEKLGGAIGSAVTVAVHPLKKNLEIAIPSGQTLILFQNGEGGTTCGDLIGLCQTTTSASAEIALDCMPNLGGLNILHLHSKQISDGKTLISTNDNDIGRVNGFLSIPITVPFSATEGWKSNDTDIIYYDGTGISLQQIDISLRDGDGRLVECSDNYVTEIGLEVFY